MIKKLVSGACLFVLFSAFPAWGFTVTTQPPENITATTLTAHGTLQNEGDADYATVRGFCYGFTAHPDRSGPHTTETAGLTAGPLPGRSPA